VLEILGEQSLGTRSLRRHHDQGVPERQAVSFLTVMEGFPAGQGAASETETLPQVVERLLPGALVPVVGHDETLDLVGHEPAHGRRPSGSQDLGLANDLLVDLQREIAFHGVVSTTGFLWPT
jgi:hypothetical protein